MRTLLVIALATATAGCTQYAHVASTNAPGVVDISTPPPRENGTDDLYVAPEYDKPGTRSIVAWIHPSFGGGQVRYGAGWELAFGVSLEKDGLQRNDNLALDQNAWGVTLDVGIVQVTDRDGGGTRTDAPGGLSLEAYYRKFIVTFGAGPVVYPDTRDVGAQVTIRAPLCHARLRYVQDTGFEAMFAWDLSFPFVFGWSK